MFLHFSGLLYPQKPAKLFVDGYSLNLLPYAKQTFFLLSDSDYLGPLLLEKKVQKLFPFQLRVYDLQFLALGSISFNKFLRLILYIVPCYLSNLDNLVLTNEPKILTKVEKVLQIQSLRKEFGKITAVDSLNLEIPKGSVFGILGPNGSGKTTTLGMVLGVISASSGSYSWFGQNLNFKIKKRIGAILETPNFYPYLSARANLNIVAKIKEIKNPDIDGALETVDLLKRSDSKFKTYSLGMKQRLAIASALLNDPEVLLLDEPTNGLDPNGIAQIRDLIRVISKRGITVIIASHLLDEVEKVCTDVAVIRFGKLLFSGSVSEMTGTEGVLEISADDNSKLLTELESWTIFSSIKESNGRLSLVLSESISASEVNKRLAEKSIYVDYLNFRKNSLEEQFLELTKNP